MPLQLTAIKLLQKPRQVGLQFSDGLEQSISVAALYGGSTEQQPALSANIIDIVVNSDQTISLFFDDGACQQYTVQALYDLAQQHHEQPTQI